ncbi:hypothetical protein ACEV60_21645 [Enterobacter ludwigii]|uniref:hypothetical protein n=1 Tax=Enterobacter ludwigii TaxID=299767 RepID=UPI00242E19E0|nr:hypothetical protein [Enterobacter ludwigii]WGA04025.1 hypothetical protein NFK84_20500 [Enterobacter ludwigii]
MKDKAELSNIAHAQMDKFLGAALDDYKNGVISKSTAVNCLAHVMAALDLDNYPEARRWFNNPQFLRDTEKGV